MIDLRREVLQKDARLGNPVGHDVSLMAKINHGNQIALSPGNPTNPAPKEEKEFGTAGDPIWVYRAKAPRITVKDDTITHAWDVHVTSKKE